MAEKHLTELPWKQLIAEHSVKDFGMQKALAAYSKLDNAKQPQEALNALNEISEIALKLKRASGAKDAIVAYAEEIIKEVKKTTLPLATKVKAAAAAEAPAKPDAADKFAKKQDEQEDEEDEEEEKEAAEFKKDLKRQMASALALAKTLAPGDPVPGKEAKPQLKFMAYLAGKACSVVIARKVGSATKKLLPEIANGVTGGKFVQGECIFEKNAHTFVLDSVPAGLAKKLSAALFIETTVKYKTRVRSTDGSTELDSDTDVDPDANTLSSRPPPPASPPAMDKRMEKKLAFEEIEFNRRQLLQRVQQLEAASFPAEIAHLKKQSLDKARQLVSLDSFEEAGKLLDALAARLKTLPSRPPPPATPPKPAAAPAAAPPRPSTPAPKLSAYMSASRDWRAARKTSADSMFALKNAIFKECDPELKKTVEARINDFSAIFTVLDDAIIDKIEAAGRESDEERQAELNQALAKFAGNMLASFRGHPLANVVDQNPFGTFTIRAPVENVLSKFVSDFGI